MNTKKINRVLEKMAEELLADTGCAFCWGEVKVPECMKELGKIQSETASCKKQETRTDS